MPESVLIPEKVAGWSVGDKVFKKRKDANNRSIALAVKQEVDKFNEYIPDALKDDSDSYYQNYVDLAERILDKVKTIKSSSKKEEGEEDDGQQ